jgi:hypothetical protein
MGIEIPMELIKTYGKEIVSILIPILTWALNRYGKSKVNLLVSQPHRFTFLVQDPTLQPDGSVQSVQKTVHTISYLIQNSSNETANKIEMIFNWKPQYFNIWSPREHTTKLLDDGRYMLTFESLSPKEYFQCELLNVSADLPNLLTVRCNECVGKFIEMYPQPIVKNWLRRIVVFFIVLGFVTSIYFVLTALQLIILKTPTP